MDRPEIALPIAILAGGLATRLRPLTDMIPKVLLEVAGKPFLEHQLAHLRNNGIRDIVLCVGFLGESVCERFGDGKDYGVSIRYSFDGPALLGTGGALRRAVPMLGDVFFVLYGDSYLNIDFVAVANAFSRSGRPALMTVYNNENQWDTSNLQFANGIIKAYSKTQRTPQMNYIDYGLSICRSSVFAGYPEAASFDLSEVMSELAARGDLAGYEATSRFYEIGSHMGLVELDRVLRTQPVEFTGHGA